MKDLLVIVPAYNEEQNIMGVIKELNRDIPDADVLVINDCSKDATLEILKKNNINYITTPFNLRYAGGVQTGFKYAVTKGYRYVAQFDGDGQHIAGELSKMYDLAKEGNVDIIIGSRFIKQTDYQHSFFRKVGTNIFVKIIKVCSGKEVTDPTSGLQILNTDVYEKYSKINNYPEYPDANLILEMLLLGYTIKEVPVKMRERVYGVSMHAGIWGPFKYMIRMFYSILLVIIKYKKVKKKTHELVGEGNEN